MTSGNTWNLPHAFEHLAEGEPEYVIDRRLYGEGVSLDRMMACAGEELPGFKASYISLPWMEGADITLRGRVPTRSPIRSDYGSTVVFDAQTGVVKSVSDIRSAGVWTQIADTFYPLHFGSFGGLPVKILWCLLGLSPGVLAVSGSVIWWQRRRRSFKEASKLVPAIDAQPVGMVPNIARYGDPNSAMTSRRKLDRVL